MMKKNEDQDVLKQFYINLHVLEPESFYFEKDITEEFLIYLDNFLQSQEFNFVISEKDPKSEDKNFVNIQLPTSKSLTNLENQNSIKNTRFDCKQRYNYYINSIVKRQPAFFSLKSKLTSNLFYQASQKIIFLGICDLIRPSLVKQIQEDKINSKISINPFDYDYENIDNLNPIPEIQTQENNSINKSNEIYLVTSFDQPYHSKHDKETLNDTMQNENQADQSNHTNNNFTKNDLNTNDLIKDDSNTNDLIKDDSNTNDFTKNDLNTNDLIQDDLNQNDLIKNDSNTNDLIKNDLNQSDLININSNLSCSNQLETDIEKIVLFDLNAAKSMIFDSLSISFLDIREALLDQISRASEAIYDRWCRAICCVFFEFVALEYEYSNLRRNSSFVSKFETFIRSLINGFMTNEKQTFHQGVISLLPQEISSFYPADLDTLDSLTTNINHISNDRDILVNNYFQSKQIRESLKTILTEKDQNLTDEIENDDEIAQKVKRLQKVYDAPSKNQALNNFSVKLMLSKAVNERMRNESRVLIGFSDSSPLIKRALELRGIVNIKQSGIKQTFSKTQPISKKNSPINKSKFSKTSKSTINQNELNSTVSKTLNQNELNINTQNAVNETHSKTLTIDVNDNTLKRTMKSPKTPKFSQTSKTIKNQKKTPKSLKAKTQPITLNEKTQNKENQVNFDFDFSEDDDCLFSTQKLQLSKMKGNKSIDEENRELLQSIRKARLAESKGFIIRERAIEQHNDIVLKSFENAKRELYTDLCSNEAKCTEELEKFSKKRETVMKSKVGKSLLFDKMEKNVRRKQINKESNHLNGNKEFFGMDYDADFSQQI